jgi:hypothetical protein
MSDIGYSGEAMDFGLSTVEIKSMAGRQLVASIAVGVVIALGLGLATLMPPSHKYAEAVQHKLALVQQPTFVSAPAERFASAKSAIELP